MDKYNCSEFTPIKTESSDDYFEEGPTELWNGVVKFLKGENDNNSVEIKVENEDFSEVLREDLRDSRSPMKEDSYEQVGYKKLLKNKICPICSTKCKELLDIDRHILAKHGHNTSALKLIKRKIYECFICSYKTLKKTNFERHLAVHGKVNNTATLQDYNCYHCSYITKDKTSIIKHLRLHKDNSVLPFTCEGCKKKFNEKSTLDSHIVKNHFKERKLMKLITNKVNNCDFCSYADVNKYKLIRHMQAKHVKIERKTKKTTRRKKLDQHM